MADAEVSNEEAEQAMKSFAEITGTDEIFAQSFLQDVNWNLEAALNAFFTQQGIGEVEFVNEEPNEAEGCQESAPPSGESPVDLTGLEISLLSWNIDGLDGNSLKTRMLAVYKIVSQINADFVFLQEVVEREIETLDKLKTFYNIYYSNRGAHYFTAILTSKMFSVDNHEVHHFENSRMERTLQIIEGKIGSVRVFLLNTHLESMAEHSDIRRAQFVECMHRLDTISKQHPDALVFFGGDLNIRDDEVRNVPCGFNDAWEAAGSPSDHRFTWDQRKNDNKRGGFARCRFDRIFWRGGQGQLGNVRFSLHGQQRIRSCLCFPSDHWAVHALFSA